MTLPLALGVSPTPGMLGEGEGVAEGEGVELPLPPPPPLEGDWEGEGVEVDVVAPLSVPKGGLTVPAGGEGEGEEDTEGEEVALPVTPAVKDPPALERLGEWEEEGQGVLEVEPLGEGETLGLKVPTPWPPVVGDTLEVPPPLPTPVPLPVGVAALLGDRVGEKDGALEGESTQLALPEPLPPLEEGVGGVDRVGEEVGDTEGVLCPLPVPPPPPPPPPPPSAGV